MDSMDLEGRPHKKRRFFAEDSSPVVQSVHRYSLSPVASPEPVNGASSPIRPSTDGQQGAQEVNTDGFDVDLLQSVVGLLSPAVLERIKTRSGNDVQQGQ